MAKSTKKQILGQNWILKNIERSIEIPCNVPCSVFEILQKAKKIEDPFYGLNELKNNWIFESDWIFENKFSLDDNLLQMKNIFLIFHGIDTLSDIKLNSVPIATTDNMHKIYQIDIKEIVKKGENLIHLTIFSPTKKTNTLIEETGDLLSSGSCSIAGGPYIRKAQYSYGWDWGPKLPDMGIWRNVEISAWNDYQFDSIYIEQNFTYNNLNVDNVSLKFNYNIESNDSNQGILDKEVQIDISSPDGFNVTKKIKLSSLISNIQINIDNPKLWWTNDLGESFLYRYTLNLIDSSTKDVIDSITGNLGIRDLKLIRKADKWGETFYFELNKIPVFAKGANWIPVDSFIPQGRKKGLYDMNLIAAVNANMNCIRIWGGGIYEDTYFYEKCDELGILIWQDFPFACGIYPYTEAFKKNVKEEAIQNIKRIRNHPSLALWCGNNEIEMSWQSIVIRDKINEEETRRKYEQGYIDIFDNLIPNLIEKYDPQRSYHSTSPGNGTTHHAEIGKFMVNSSIVNDPNEGDSHFWKVWHENAPFSEYREFPSRFMSEYGFESFPAIRTIDSFCPPEDRDIYSKVMENHQKNMAGNRLITNYMKRRFNIPRDFEKQIILSQLTQAEALEYGIEFWRQNRNDFHCMGSIIWQLNDCWPVASWASIDYFGRWKAAHYFIKRSYEPFIASIREDKKSVQIWTTNDYRTKMIGVLNTKILNSKGNILYEKNLTVEVPSCTSKLNEEIELEDILENIKDLTDKVIFFSLKYQNKKKEEINAFGFRLFDAPKKFPLENPHLSFKVLDHILSKGENELYYQIQIEINSKSIGLYVFVDMKEYDFTASDNYFGILQNQARKITLKVTISDVKTKFESIISDICIKSLYDLIDR